LKNNGPVELAVFDEAPRSPLTTAFALGGLLPEGLRTLEVTPNRIVQPGGTVSAAFTLRNPGGGSASGFRVRFRLPEGLSYAPGSARIDGSPIADESGSSALLAPSGAEIGEIPAGGARRISLDFVVEQPLENGTQIPIQAAIASEWVPVIGSNVVRLIVRSRPVLQNEQTTLGTASHAAARPGDELPIVARVHNSGQSSAHDLVVMLPVPSHTTVVPQSLTVDGRLVADQSPSGQFRFARPATVTPVLAPGATVTIGYRLRVDTPLEDATPITVQGTVSAREAAEFSLAPVMVSVSSAASFEGSETSFHLACSDEVEPGERIPLVLAAKNIGTATARDLSLTIALPDGLAYIAGSLSIDGAYAPDRGAAPELFKLGDLEPDRTIEVAIAAIVQSPLPNGFSLRPQARVMWSRGERTFERRLSVRSTPRFPADFNRIERETPQRIGPGDAVVYSIALANMGTDVATAPRLQLTPDQGLRVSRVIDGMTELGIGADGIVALDPLEPGVARRLRVEGSVAGVIEDQKSLRLKALLLPSPDARIELGAPVHIIESLPKFSVTTSRLTVDSVEAPRLRRVSKFRLTLTNEGTDCAHNIRVALNMPEELRIDGIDNALLDGDAIAFGEIPAGQTRAAVLRVRLVGIVAGGDPMTITARVSGSNVVPLNLTPIELETRGEAAFREGATLMSRPANTIQAGGELIYTLRLHNSGDGSAKHLTARISQLKNAVYAQGSTTVNGVALADHGGSSLLLGDAGLHLADIGIGVEVVIGWRAIVNMPLPSGTKIEAAACVRWDDASEIAVEAAPVSVESKSALPVIDPELPFSVLDAIAAPGLPRTF
jgi:uncharacterized repeat protein (TIGR01451 family)